MNCWITIALMTLLFGFGKTASAITYYIAANGSDSNSGASKTAPWQHAPGMPNCTATCAATRPQPGDSFIFRGGDTWHTANSGAADGNTNAYTGYGPDAVDSRAVSSWNWDWSGSSSNCTWTWWPDSGLPAQTSSCIYIGVDKAWYSGSRWTRPSFNLDNPLSTSLVASCAFDETTAFHGISLGQFFGYPGDAVGYLIFDNFNFYGHCLSGVPTPEWGYMDVVTKGYVAVIDCYFHGFTETFNPQPNGQAPEDQAGAVSFGYTDAVVPNGATHDVVAWDVFDGSDDYCVGVNACIGGGASEFYDYSHNVERYLAGTVGNAQNNMAHVHDNLFEYMYESFDPAAHGGVLEQNGNDLNQPMEWYNNIVRSTSIGEVLGPDPTPSSPLYFFNNVLEGGGAGVIQFASISNFTGEQAYLTNNTFDNNNIRTSPNGNGTPFRGTITFENNHIIASGATSISVWVPAQSGVTFSDPVPASEIFQAESAANGQGYTSGNDYQPTSTSGATVGKGTSLALQCLTYSVDDALCSGSTDAVEDTMGTGTLPVIDIPSPLLRGIHWDAGAFQFAGSSASTPNAPTGLVATVH